MSSDQSPVVLVDPLGRLLQVLPEVAGDREHHLLDVHPREEIRLEIRVGQVALQLGSQLVLRLGSVALVQVGVVIIFSEGMIIFHFIRYIVNKGFFDKSWLCGEIFSVFFIAESCSVTISTRGIVVARVLGELLVSGVT